MLTQRIDEVTSLMYTSRAYLSLQWRYKWSDGVSIYQLPNCLLNRLFWRRSKKTSKLRITGLCAGNSPVPGEFPHKWQVTRKMFSFDDVIMCIDNDPSKIVCQHDIGMSEFKCLDEVAEFLHFFQILLYIDYHNGVIIDSHNSLSSALRIAYTLDNNVCWNPMHYWSSFI